jgi:hypothetical protein
MRLVQDKNVWLKLCDFIADLLRLRDLIVAKDFDFSLDGSPPLELTTPVDLGNGRTDHNDLCEAECITGCDNLKRLAEALLIGKECGRVLTEKVCADFLVIE